MKTETENYPAKVYLRHMPPDQHGFLYGNERYVVESQSTFGVGYVHHDLYDRLLYENRRLRQKFYEHGPTTIGAEVAAVSQPDHIGIQRDAKKLEKGFPEVVDLWLSTSGTLYHARSSDDGSHSRRYFRADRSVHRDIHERILQENAKAVAAVVKECQAEIDKLKDAIANLESELHYQGKR